MGRGGRCGRSFDCVRLITPPSNKTLAGDPDAAGLRSGMTGARAQKRKSKGKGNDLPATSLRALSCQ
jgi:hypothetical protein